MGLRNNKESYKTTKRMKRKRSFTTVAEDKVENKRRHKMSRHVGWIVWGGEKEREGKNVQTPVMVPCSARGEGVASWNNRAGQCMHKNRTLKIWSVLQEVAIQPFSQTISHKSQGISYPAWAPTFSLAIPGSGLQD